MAATGKTPILLYGSTTATNAPVAGNLTNSSDGCEIAINVADKNLFFKDSTNVVNTVPIRQSNASSNGWLSSADWSTFNGKQPAGTYVTSVTGTAPVVSSGGTTPAISMAAATTSVNGYLTSTDWNTFNGKYSTGGALGTPSSGTLSSCTVDGTNAVGYKNIPQTGSDKTTAYTLAIGDVGKYVGVGTSGSIVVPTSTFANGDAISIFNNTTGNITITTSAPTAYIAGTNTVKTSITLATRGIATILFVSATVCVVSGNVS